MRKRQPRELLNPEVQERYTAALRSGVSTARAARAAGVTRQLVNYWCKCGRKAPAGIYGDFLRAVVAVYEELVKARAAELGIDVPVLAKGA